MTRIDDRRHAPIPHLTPTTAARANASRELAANDAALQHAIDRAVESPDRAAFLARLREAPLASEAPRAERIALAKEAEETRRLQQNLDSFRARFAGPFTVEGKQVEARPMFRMNTPTAYNAASARAHAKELYAICRRAGIAGYASLASCGRPSPEQLVAVTQALIDAGKLPAASPRLASAESRIRAMQWEWGIGVDCAGYTQQAAQAAHEKAGGAFKANLMGDIFSGMARDPRFRKVAPNDMRAGDVIHLDNPKRGEVGHNVVVYSHRLLDDASRKDLRRQCADAEALALLEGKGPLHVVEVDSSWGADDGKDYGGYRRDTWVFDESSMRWGTFVHGDRRSGSFVVDPIGPQGELFAGAYRPKEAR